VGEAEAADGKPVKKEMGRDADEKENGDKDHGLQHREAL
jgi:hypothetical protein